jgi:parallel beta-helix repeat protein/predicted outer membrane repeat protein
MRITNGTTFLAILVVFIVAPTAVGKAIYVDDDATGANNGSSWADACNYLQDALMMASAGDKIRVAQGIYKPDQFVLSKRPNLGRRETFQLKNSVAIRGGYAGLGEADPNARDVELYETILSGDLAGDDVDVNDAADLPDERTRAENSYHVVTANRTDETAVLDGFAITGGNADGEYRDSSSGGGIYNDESSSPTLTNCTFSRNSAMDLGGGMYNHKSSSPILTNCTFSGNSATWYGGGMHNDAYSSPNLTACNFIGNSTKHMGGGMYNDVYSSPNLTDCNFIENSTMLRGGGMYSDWKSIAILTACTFSGNSAIWYGGGIHNDVYSSPNLTDCNFIGNSAKDSGGGMYNTGSSPRLTQCVFTGNKASVNGGALVDIGYQESTVLSQCMFTGNAAEYGGAIWIDEQSSILSNCTFSGNVARQGGGAIYCWDASVMTLTNCILWDNLPHEIDKTPTSVTPEIYHSDVNGGWTGRGDNNIAVNPLFADHGYWDPNGTPEDPNDDYWVDGDYHLRSQAGRWDPVSESWVKDDVSSPCIDAGDPNSPIGHEPFPNGGVINMGAYGGTAQASKSYFGEPTCETIIAGDINGDCKVDFSDFAIMALHWLEDDNP